MIKWSAFCHYISQIASMQHNYSWSIANSPLFTMRSLSISLLLVLVLVSVSYMSAPVKSACCYPVKRHCPNALGFPMCGDCTRHSIFCGVGTCNIFGCNCDHGCRGGSEYERNKPSVWVNNAYLSFTELPHSKAHQCPPLSFWQTGQSLSHNCSDH